jgi:hypothetical protein
VVFLASSGVTNSHPLELLGETANEQLGGSCPSGWENDITRWLEEHSSAQPVLLLVLDGINERNPPVFWRELLDRLAAEPQREGRIAVLVTCRTAYWERHLQPIEYLEQSSHVWKLEPYDDNELDFALSQRQISRSDLPPQVLPMVRKPRYLDLALNHRSRLRESGDLTRERLIYEDWRHRLSRKRDLPLSDEQFQDLLRELAERYREGERSYRESEILQNLPANQDYLI